MHTKPVSRRAQPRPQVGVEPHRRHMPAPAHDDSPIVRSHHLPHPFDPMYFDIACAPE
jgi:hypothetical protein